MKNISTKNKDKEKQRIKKYEKAKKEARFEASRAIAKKGES